MAQMHSRWRPYFSAFAPAAAWQVVIFFLSGSIGSGFNTERFLITLSRLLHLGLRAHTIVQLNMAWRTMAHLFLYMVFALLLRRGFRALPEGAPKPADSRVWVWVLVLVAACAMADEFHQWMLPDRAGTASDVLLDAFGGGIGLAGGWMRERRRAASYVPN